MPALTFPSPPLDTTQAVQAQDMRDLIDNASAPQNSLAIINGHLDDENTASTFLLEAEHTQRGSHVRGYSASGTADLDFFLDAFGDVNTTIGSNESHFVPGAGRRFWMPWEGDALIFWSIGWGNNVDASGSQSALWMNLDGTFLGPTVRRIEESARPATPFVQYGVQHNRFYSGHWLATGLSEGWHTADLKIASNGAAHTRVYSRSIKALALKKYT